MKAPNSKLARNAAAGMLLALASLAVPAPALAEDIDIYQPNERGGAPNVMFLLDNTSNWSAQLQAWTPGASWSKCKDLSELEVTRCKAAIEDVFYAGKPANEKRPWEPGFKDWGTNVSPTQGQDDLRSLRFALTR